MRESYSYTYPPLSIAMQVLIWVNWSNVEWKRIAQGFSITAEHSCWLTNTVCWTLVCLQVNLGHYMRTLFFDIMQADNVLFICILSSKPETRTTSRKWREAAMQVSKILKYYCHYEYGIIAFVSGNIWTCVHRYEIMSITTIKHATESITLNIVSLLGMLMCLSNDIAHHNPSQLAILPGNTFSILI